MAAASISATGIGWWTKTLAPLLAAIALSGAGHFSAATAFADGPHGAGKPAGQQIIAHDSVGEWPTFRNASARDEVFNPRSQPSNFDRGYLSP